MQKETIYQLPDEWEWESLSKVSFIEDYLRRPINSIERQRRVTGKQDHELYPYYGATGQVGYIDSYLTDGNYILIGEDGAPFLDPFKDKAYEIKGKTWVNNHAHILRVSNFFNSKFLLYYLNQFDYKDFVSGTTRLKLTKSSLMGIPVPVPPLEEQNRIVERIEEIFSELDNGVAKLNDIQKQLDTYHQALLKHSFQKQKKEESNFYLLKDICTIIGGVTKGRNLIGKETIDLPYLRVANVQDGFLDLKEVKIITVLNTDKEKYKLKYGDILYTEGGDRDKLGRGTVWKEEIKDCIHQNHIFRARPISGDYDPNYISYYSRTKEAKEYFFKNGKQTTNLASINISILSNLPVPIVPIEEQLRIVEQLDSNFSIYNNAKEFIQEILKDVLRLKYRVLRKAFSGELVERYLVKDTVSELLKSMDTEKAENEENQKKYRQNQPKRKNMSEQFKEIIDILQESKAPISAKDVWEKSLYRDNIEKFYSELKKVHNLVIEKEKGMLSFNHKEKNKI